MTSKKREEQIQIKNEPVKLAADFSSFRLQAILLIIIGLIFYSNSYKNEYALDDGIVILKNQYVQDGFKGIKKILSTDAYDSFYSQMNAKQQLSGGRYRPLSIVTFAIEQQLFGSKTKSPVENELATFRHIGNVVLYILSVVFLLYFLRKYIFEINHFTAFVIALLFLTHPIHTEVVANIKSRDEILSFLFIVVTFIFGFRYYANRQSKTLFTALFFYFLALLSKEYAITLIVLIPILLYIKKEISIKEVIVNVIPFIIIALIYLGIRYSIVGVGATIENPDVLNNPYKFASPVQKLATKIELLNHYLRLLIYPYPLSSDYSYATIPYTTFKDWKVWLSIGIHLSMVIAMIVLFFRRQIIAFALAFYLVNLFLVSNLKFEIGATMGERLIYHSSFGFCMLIGIPISAVFLRIKENKQFTVLGLIIAAVVLSWFGKLTIERNAEWKNDTTLFIADAETVPNSVLVNGNAGKAFIDLSERPENKSREKELIQNAIFYLNKAVTIHNEYVNGYLNLGAAYYKLGDYDKAKEYWEKAKVMYPNNPFLKRNFELLGQLYYNKAMTIGVKHPEDAIALLEKAVEVAPSNVDYWYNLGGASFTINDFGKARNAWKKVLELNPDYQQAKQGLAAIEGK